MYSYETYLNGIEEQKKLISSSSLFDTGDLFSKRNAQMIPEKYRHLHGVRLKAENPQGILLATESATTDLILIVLIIILVYFLFCMEREEGTMDFVRCTKFGGRRLGVAKLAVVFAGSLAGALLLYGSNFLIAGSVYGFGDLGRGLQSVEGYIGSPWRISVGLFFLLFLAAKLAAVTVIVGVAAWIALKGKSILTTSIMLLGVIFLEYGLYTAIPVHSNLDLLRQCNFFSYMQTERFFKSYETVNLLMYPVSAIVVCGVTGLAVLIVTVWRSRSIYERVSQGEYSMKKSHKRVLRIRKTSKGHSVLYYEAYKIFWIHRAGILMLCFLALQVFQYSGEKASFTLDELYYKNYIQKVEGEVTKEKLAFIEEEGQRIDRLNEESLRLAQNPDGMSQEELNAKGNAFEKQLRCQNGYNQVKAQAERIGESGVFLDEIGFTHLLDS